MAHADVRGWLPECQQEVGKSKNTQKEQEHTFSGHHGLRFQLYKLQDPCHALQPRKGAIDGGRAHESSELHPYRVHRDVLQVGSSAFSPIPVLY